MARSDQIGEAIDAKDWPRVAVACDEAITFVGNMAATTDDPDEIGELVDLAAHWLGIMAAANELARPEPPWHVSYRFGS